MIRGKKNYLLGVQLQLGFGLMFRLDEESTQRHLLEKKERQSLRSASVSVDQSEVGEGEEMDLNDAEDEDQYPDVEVKLDSLKVDDNQEEGKANEVEDEEEEDLPENLDTEEAILSSLTSEPKPDDGLLFIVAVCGPYTAMQKFKYKVCF
jgi:hypothetical protein